MPFHFKKGEPPDRAVRRVCRELLGKALVRLRKPRHPAAIHAVRKEIKKLRAILRLVQGEIDGAAGRKLEKALRRAANQLAAPRDARVMWLAFEKLAGRNAARRYPLPAKALEKNCRQESRRFRGDDSAVQSKRILQKAGKRLARLKIPGNGWAAVEPGLRESYRAGQRGVELARREPSVEHFHEWRKEVKVLWNQLKVLCPAWPAAGRGVISRLGRLGTLLGEDHDLALLKEFVANHDEAGETAALKRLIAARQKKLRTGALKLAAQVYAEDAADIVGRLGKAWNGWQ